jgi:hypothetical protein
VENARKSVVFHKERKSGQKERKEDRPDGNVENAKSRVSHIPTGPAASDEQDRSRARTENPERSPDQGGDFYVIEGGKIT